MRDARLRVFRRVREISKKFGVSAISITVNKKDYDGSSPCGPFARTQGNITTHGRYVPSCRTSFNRVLTGISHCLLSMSSTGWRKNRANGESRTYWIRPKNRQLRKEGLGNLQTGAFAGARTFQDYSVRTYWLGASINAGCMFLSKRTYLHTQNSHGTISVNMRTASGDIS